MKTIKNLFLVALLLLATQNVFSQDSKSRAQKMTDKMKADLNLTDDQSVQVLPVNQVFVESMQEVRADDGGKLAKYQKFKTADEKRDGSLKEILTQEQYSLFIKQKEENREAMREARKNKNK